MSKKNKKKGMKPWAKYLVNSGKKSGKALNSRY
jgi:hypothetical protein